MVAARETSLVEILEGNRQYLVPLYQRTYSWTTKQFDRLWDDIVRLADDRRDNARATHFIGSLVLAPAPRSGPSTGEWLVVDGQQRLTTLTILLAAIRDHRAKTEGAEHRERIDEQWLINRWREGDARYKLLPTQADRAAYFAILDSAPQAGTGDPIGAAYNHFTARLVSADDPDDPDDIAAIEDAVIHGLALVCVTAQEHDNVHRIFESLNNTGLALGQGDLLRNYLFMRMPTLGPQVYQSLWLPLQSRLEKNLELLFWLDLVQRDSRVNQADTFSRQQERLERLRTEEEIRDEVHRFARLGELLAKVLNPDLETHEEVRARLARLNSWGTTTVYPLLLHLLDRRSQGTATSEQVARAMGYVEAFFVRRLVIGRATANLNRILLSIVTEIDPSEPVDEQVHAYLSRGRKYYATDDEVRAAVSVIPFYLNGRASQRARVLAWLEESYGSREPVHLKRLTIEHVLPQTPTQAWKDQLTSELSTGEDLDQVYSSLVHTLGNLTLTGYNSPLSNKPFDDKRTLLRTSGLLMNQEIASEYRWGRAQILARGSHLAERIVTLWPGPATSAPVGDGPAWDVLARAVAELPAGSWTTYGDLAALIGSHPVPVGQYIGSRGLVNEHRVLQNTGTISPGFRWSDPDRHDDPMVVLQEEGVEFDGTGRANPAARVTVAELAELAGMSSDDLPADALTIDPGQDPVLRDQFLQQLTDAQGPHVATATAKVLAAWTSAGGHLGYGTAAETSCFLHVRPVADPRGAIWPMTVYPTGRAEVVFQYLRTRAPFDDLTLREQLRERLSKVPDIDLPAAKDALRPGFDLSVLADDFAVDVTVETLAWFLETVREHDRTVEVSEG